MSRLRDALRPLGDLIAIQRHRAAESIETTNVGRARVGSDRRKSQDVASEFRARAKGGRAADLPEDVAGGCAVDELDGRSGAGDQGRAGLEDPDAFGVVEAVEDEVTVESARGGEGVHAGDDGEAGEVSLEGLGILRGGDIVGSLEVRVCVQGMRIGGVG